MRPSTTLCLALGLAATVACTPPVDPPLVDPDPDTDTEPDPDTDPPPPGVGDPMPAFARQDINPSSPTFGETIASADLAGHAYSVILLDCRCNTCVDVADDMYTLFQENPAWWDAVPTFMVNGPSGGDYPELVERMVENNSMPYLQDHEEGSIWFTLQGLNHDWYIVDEAGVIDARIELYVWPADTVKFTDEMAARAAD